MTQQIFALLHGGGQGSWVWDETKALLRARGAVVMPLDIPGCGTKRGRETSALSVDDIAAELLGDLDAAGMTSDVTLVGHSLAGTIVPRMAERDPGRFARLVFLSCSAPNPGQTVLEQGEERGFGELAALEPRERYRRMFCNDMDGAQAEAFLDRLGSDHWPSSVFAARDWRYDRLAAIPSSYILCEQDHALTPAFQEQYAATLRCNRIVRLDAGHQAMNTKLQELAELLLATGER